MLYDRDKELIASQKFKDICHGKISSYNDVLKLFPDLYKAEKPISVNIDDFWYECQIIQKDNHDFNIVMLKDITEQKKMEMNAYTDSLTKIYNRRYFEIIFNELTKNLRNNNDKQLYFLIIDIDHFKRFNDFYGHVKGDEILKETATILSQNFKRSNDYVFRIGGEEMVVLFFAKNNEEAIKMINQLLSTFEEKQIEHKESPYGYLTVSGGLTVVNSSNETAYQIADKLLYQSKKEGRNRISANF